MQNLIQFYTFSEIYRMRMSSACRFSPASRPAVWSPWSSSRGTWNPLCTKTMRILNYFLSMQNVKHLLKSDRFFTAILVSKMWQITRLQYIIIFFYLSRIVQCCGSDFSKIRIYSIDPGPNTNIRVADLDTIFYTYGVSQYVFSGCGS